MDLGKILISQLSRKILKPFLFMREILIIQICRIGLGKFLIGRADLREISRTFSLEISWAFDSELNFEKFRESSPDPVPISQLSAFGSGGISYKSALQ